MRSQPQISVGANKAVAHGSAFRLAARMTLAQRSDSDLMTAAYPAFAQDPVMTRLRWEHPRRGFAYGRFIAERGGTPIAFLGWVHGPWQGIWG